MSSRRNSASAAAVSKEDLLELEYLALLELEAAAREKEFIERDREECPGSLALFFRRAWPVMRPGIPLVDTWLIDAVCEHLQAAAEGQIKKLLINIPPRFLKSYIGAVAYTPWVWLRRASAQFLYTSYSGGLAVRDSVRARALIQSPWYQARWGDRYKLCGDMNLKLRFENDRRGLRLATGLEGSNTGEGGDFVIEDDPHNVLEAESEPVREEAVRIHREVLVSRRNDPQESVWIVIMQRVHEKDVSGACLEDGGWVHLRIPMEFNPAARCVTLLGWEDPREKAGELLCPERFGPEQVKDFKKTSGSRAYAAQYNQEPEKTEGRLVKRQWFTERFYKVPPKQVRCDRQFQVWDMAFESKESCSFVVGQVWATKGAEWYLLDQVRDQMDFPATLAAVAALTRKWPKARSKYIEKKANGPAVCQTLRTKVPGLVLVNPLGSKEARMAAATPYMESGNVWLPDPQHCPWVDEFFERLLRYPDEPNDEGDCVSMAILVPSRAANPAAAKLLRTARVHS